MKKLQKPRAEAEHTRSRLVEAAAAIFAERGYEAATTREICARARANAAAVNYHFGDKLGLYKAALASVMAQHDSGVETLALSAMPAEDALRAFIRSMLDHVSGGEPVDLYTRLMAHELSEPTPGLALVVKKIIAPRAQLLSGIVARLTRGSVNSLATRMATHSIMAQVVHYAHAMPVIRLLWPNWQFDDAARRSIIDHVTNFSLAGLKDIRHAAGKKRAKR